MILKGGRLICPSTQTDALLDVRIRNGMIVDIAPALQPVPEERIYDCQGLCLLPGFVDLLGFCGLPNALHREDLNSFSAAAAAGGYTQAMVSSQPQGGHYDSPAIVGDILAQTMADQRVSIGVFADLTRRCEGIDLSEMGRMLASGAAGFWNGPFENTLLLRRAMQYAKPFGVPVVLRPGDVHFERFGVMHEGIVSTRIGLRGIPASAEEIGVTAILSLVRDTGCPVHLSHISSGRSVDLIDRAKNEGLPITTSTTARHLLLTDAYIEQSMYDTRAKLATPLRTAKDRDALIVAVKSGVIDIVISDHLPCTRVEKECEFSLATDGAMGLESAAKAVFTALGDLVSLVKSLATNPGNLIGVDKSLKIGAAADIVLFDSEKSEVLTGPFYSKGTNEPLDGMSLRGQVVATLLRGSWTHGWI